MTACVTLLSVSIGHAEDSSTTKPVLLRYQFDADEEVRYEVTHVAKTKTRLRGIEEISQVHTVSEKVWKFKSASKAGQMTFDHLVDAVSMMQQTGEAEEVRWDSRSTEAPPIVFGKVAESLGMPLSTVTIDARGAEVDRQTHGGTQAQLGMGGLTLDLPEKAIAVGDSWTVPREVRARLESGEIKVVKVREVYTLDRVQTGVASIKLRTEVLTPIDDASIKAQIVQQISNGLIQFDVDAGRVLNKQLDWDETVVGFQGANSMMEYRARLTEKLLPATVRTAKR